MLCVLCGHLIGFPLCSYLYHPLDTLYLVLITNRASNIVEDLDTLRLVSKGVSASRPLFSRFILLTLSFHLCLFSCSKHYWDDWKLDGGEGARDVLRPYLCLRRGLSEILILSVLISLTST